MKHETFLASVDSVRDFPGRRAHGDGLDQFQRPWTWTAPSERPKSGPPWKRTSGSRCGGWIRPSRRILARENARPYFSYSAFLPLNRAYGPDVQRRERPRRRDDGALAHVVRTDALRAAPFPVRARRPSHVAPKSRSEPRASCRCPRASIARTRIAPARGSTRWAAITNREQLMAVLAGQRCPDGARRCEPAAPGTRNKSRDFQQNDFDEQQGGVQQRQGGQEAQIPSQQKPRVQPRARKRNAADRV